MNKDWSEKNKKMQTLIGKEATFREGLEELFELRSDLFGQVTSIVNTWEDSIRDVVNNERRQAPQEPVEPVAEPIAEEPENNDNFEIPVLQDINYSELINNLDNSIAFTERRRTRDKYEFKRIKRRRRNTSRCS